MSDFVFLNVYSGCSPKDKENSGDTSLWNVYLNEKENMYLIQKLDENNKPTAEKYKISPTFFGVNFRKVNNAQTEAKTKKDIIFIRSKDKTKDKTDDLLKNTSSALSSVKSETANKKRTGEFLIQLSANKPQAIQKKNDEAPKSNLSAKKTTNEFQLGVSETPKKKTAVNDFGLSSLLNTVAQSAKKETAKPTLTISTQNINKISNTQTAPAAPTAAAAQNPAAASGSAIISGSATSSEPVNLQTAQPPQTTQTARIVQASQPAQPAQTTQTVQAAQAAIPATQHIGNVINVETPAAVSQNRQPEQKADELTPKSTQAANAVIPQKPAAQPAPQPAEKPAKTQTADAQPAKAEPAPAKDNAPKDNITGTEEALLQPKAVEKEFQLSEKALKLDMSLRAEFQVSLLHWDSQKKNLAKRHFYDILTRPGNYVPAHKHMFTDFAIKLRKINLPDLALQFATKSTTLSPDDSHAFFNVARLYYELGRYEEAEGFIDKALELESDLSPALRLSNIIKECIRRKVQNR